jgi:hypothetical protein
MAVVETVGRVEYLKVADGYGFVSLQREATEGPRSELLILWFGDRSEGPAALFTSLLSLALARALRVKASHEHDSAYILQLVVEAAPAPAPDPGGGGP